MGMNVQVSGRHMDVGEALRTRITDELSAGIGKYFERGGDAQVIVVKDGSYGIHVECVVNLASGQRLESRGDAADAHAAFGIALHKIETRIRRYKRKLKSHSVAASAKEAETAALWVLRSPEDEVDDGWAEHEGESPPAAMVIAETDTPLKTLTVSGAVMELDLTESQAIVFRNAAHGGLSVVYRRADGNIGWVDPELVKPPSRVAVGAR